MMTLYGDPKMFMLSLWLKVARYQTDGKVETRSDKAMLALAISDTLSREKYDEETIDMVFRAMTHHDFLVSLLEDWLVSGTDEEINEHDLGQGHGVKGCLLCETREVLEEVEK